MGKMQQQRRTGLQFVGPAGVLLLLFALSSPAQQLSRFEAHPEKRRQFVEQAHARSVKDRREAEAWAKAHGKGVKEEHPRHLRELMAVRNGMPIYYRTFNDKAAISTATDLVQNTVPYNLNGDGIKVGVWDAGAVLSSHVELVGRVTVVDNVATHYHSTHVAGTIGASGVDAAAKGMAPSVNILSYKWDNDTGEVGAIGASGANQPAKVYVTNHSYGYDIVNPSYYYLYGLYDSEVRQMDEALYGLEYCLPFAAAGNDQSVSYKSGYDTISLHGIAKNVMTVGAVKDAVSGSTRNLNNATMTTFSSWGPSDDGRIKPDIVANGYYLYSCTDSGNSNYLSIPGTSMATPNACGSAALLVEYYKELFSGGAMRASTLKGLIIHTADDLGNAGPDYQYGWGLMNTKAAADLLKEYAEGATTKLTEATVTTAQPSDTYSFQWNGVDPIRVTLCWTDPAGSEDSADDDRVPDLVNDLDLKITGPGGTYYPYKLDYANPTANATANSENNVDNVEQVYIEVPVAGLYTITVNYDGSLTGGQQHYSLLIDGTSQDSDADEIPDYWEALYFSNPTGAAATVDSDGDGADNLTEYVSGHDPTNAASVFKVVTYEAPVAASNAPFIVTWDPVAGRVYNVSWNHDLKYGSFANISGDLPYPANSYTDSVERVPPPNFYRIDVRLDQ